MMFRQMREEDLSQVEMMERELFSDPWGRQGFMDTLASPHAYTLVAEDVGEDDQELKSEIVGYIVMYISFDEGEISKVAVAKKKQSCGIGASLLETMLHLGCEKNVTRYILEVRESNEPAIALYSKFHFDNIGTRRDFYENPKEDAIIMIREEETE